MVVEKLEKEIKLPEGRVFQLPTDLDDLYTGMEDVGLGPRYIRHYRKGEWHVELGGPKHEYAGFIFAEIEHEADKIRDGRVELIGPELNEIPSETTLPFALMIRVHAPALPPEYGVLIERFAYTGILYLEGMMMNGTRATSWLRIGKAMAPKLSFKNIAQSIRSGILSTAPMVDAVEVKWVIATPEVGGREKIEEMLKEIFPIWWAVDEKFMAIKDQDVDTLYGCTVCRFIAPNHVCIISPELMPFCGLFPYLTCQLFAMLAPGGPFFAFPRGDIIDLDMGHFSGVDAVLPEKTGGMHKHFTLYSAIKYPTTNCGCMEAIAFYMPEVDGIGIAQRRYSGATPMGITFGKMASLMSGGIQNHGFKGLAVQSLRYPKLLKGDGGWNRIVWMPKTLKQEVADSIPEEVYEKIATEEDAVEPEDIKRFLLEKKHPIVEKYWKEGQPQPIKLPLPGEEWPE